ncbi:MAG: sialidase family protein [Candidatus Latescibacterota bacterium]
MLRVIAKGVVHKQSPALIAGICRTAGGDLLVCFNSGGDLSAGQQAAVVRSADGGRTWGRPEAVFESIFTRGGVEAGCSLTRLSSGRLLAPYADGYYLHPGTSNHDRRALLFCPLSDDGGATWTHGRAQCYEGLEAFAFGRVVELPDGELLLPLWGAYDRQGQWVPAVLRSGDQGETWGEWAPIAPHGDETPIVRLPDGRILALLRDYDAGDSSRPFYVAHSADGGRTWSAPRRVALHGTSPSLHLSGDQRLIAGYRSTLPGCNCQLTTSGDGGESWEFALELELPFGHWHYGGYPVVEDLPDGRLIAVFHNADPAWYVAYNILEWG